MRMVWRQFFLSLALGVGFLIGAGQAGAQEVFFGVNIDEGRESVSGYAWSDGVGWIDFGGVIFDSQTGELAGNAQIVEINNKGGDGALSMQGDCTPSCGGYGVVVENDGRLTGHAWNELIGWVEFAPDFGGVTHDSANSPSVTGWAWNDNIGWIQMAEAALPTPSSDCTASPFNTCQWAWNDEIGWISHNSIDNPSSAQFGVHVDDVGGTVSGHAWNEGLGYIDFSGAAYDPDTGELSGTAQITGFGPDGTVTLQGDCNPSCGGYGVEILPDGTVDGYAWNDVTGWIDFSQPLGGVVYDAELEPSLSGHAWNESYGWIAFNYTDFDIEYGVDLDSSGSFDGFAWSDNVGWINYAPAGPYPEEPNHAVRWDSSSGEISGWAQIISMGTDGWVKFRSTASDAIPYGVLLDAATGDWSGYAWNNTIGWIDFTHILTNTHTDLADAQGVATPILQSPLSCVDTYTLYGANALTPLLEWSMYEALDNSTQERFHVQVSDNPLFTSTVVDENIASSSYFYSVGLGALEYNVTYYWRVRVQSSNGEWSDWGEEGPDGASNCFRTALHAPPACAFSLDPAEPIVGEPVQFTDESVPYGGASIERWDWDFGDGNTQGGSIQELHQNPEHTYQDRTDVTVRLEVTDTDGYQCTASQNFSVTQQLPRFRRIIPR